MARSNGIYEYRARVFRDRDKKCEECGYNDIPEILHVHHIDRNRKNGSLSNLKILCPNCHMEDHFIAKDGQYKWAKNKTEV
jgi:5-methylcytosine-specific restriction endonuclease McrA